MTAENPHPRTIDLDARTAWLMVAILAVIGATLRLRGLGEYWYNPDEAIWLWVSGLDSQHLAPEMLARPHPPLYYLILRAMLSISREPTWLRMTSLVPGVLLIPLIHLLATRFAGARTAGVTAAALVAGAPAAIELSQVIRPSMLPIALSALGVWALLRYLESPEPRLLALYSATMLTSLLLHYGTLNVIAAVVIAAGAVLVKPSHAPLRPPLLLAHVPLAAVGVALFTFHLAPRLAAAATQEDMQGAWPYADGLTDLIVGGVGAGIYLFGPWLSVLVILAGSVGLARLVSRRRVGSVALVAGILGVTAALSLTHLYPLGATRHSLYLLLVAAPAVGSALIGLPSSRPSSLLVSAAALSAALVVAGIWETSRPRPGVPEKLFPAADIAAIREWPIFSDPGSAVLLTDHQTSFMLWALLGQGPPPRPHSDSLSTFRAGDHDFVKARQYAWLMEWRRDRERTPTHLATVADDLLDDSEWRSRIETSPLWLVQAGWGDLICRHPEAPWIVECLGQPTFAAARLDLPTYLSYAAAAPVGSDP